MAQACVYGPFVRGPHELEEEPLPLVQRRGASQPESSRWMPPSSYRPARFDDEELDAWHEFARTDRVSFADDPWEDPVLADEHASMEREWRRRRPRRVMVKMLGWSSILAALLGVGYIGLTAGARDAMVAWGTFAASVR